MDKNLEDLKAIKEKILKKNSNNTESESYDVVIGMATCGIASGARPVLNEFMKQIEAQSLNNIKIRQSGCMGLCVLEPIVEIKDKNGEKTTYIKMSVDKVDRVIEEHIIGGKIVDEYLINQPDDDDLFI